MKSTPSFAARIGRVHARPILATLAAALAFAACSTLRVQTLGAPQANFGQYRTFRILEAPAKVEGGSPPAWAAEPMLNNSITFDAGREFLRQALVERGFVEDRKSPDFNVAFYASARERLIINNWGYGYGWNNYVTEYTEGTVLVDLVDPDTKKLLWRGRGVATVSDNPNKYMRELARIVPKIVDRMPEAVTPSAIVSR